jgi:hypothetical protein
VGNRIAYLESVHTPLEPRCCGRPRVHVALPESLVLLLVYCCPFCVLWSAESHSRLGGGCMLVGMLTAIEDSQEIVESVLQG